MNILLVDDHPMTVEGYILALSPKNGLSTDVPAFYRSYSCESAYNSMMEALRKGKVFDLAIIDLDLPGCQNPPIASGKELAMLFKKNMPDTKIIIITAHTELVIIYDIWKIIQPEGLIIKNDLTPEGMLTIVSFVLNDGIYKSPMVEDSIKEIWKKELVVEDYNRQILYYLSLGFKAKDLHEVIPISKGTIQKRIVKMNEAFNVTDKEGLLKEVKRLGYI